MRSSKFSKPSRKRPIQILDPRSPAFAAEAQRQSLAIANSLHEKDDQEFINSVSDLSNK